MLAAWELLLVNRAERISKTIHFLGLREKHSYFHPGALAEARRSSSLHDSSPAALMSQHQCFPTHPKARQQQAYQGENKLALRAGDWES